MVKKCPSCGAKNDAHDGIDNEKNEKSKPEPGDVSICFYCSGIGVFTEDGIRLPTNKEFLEYLSDDRIQKALDALGAMRNG